MGGGEIGDEAAALEADGETGTREGDEDGSCWCQSPC